MLQQKMPPLHPGEILKDMYLDPLEICITALADNLGVARKTISQLVNGHMGVSAPPTQFLILCQWILPSHLRKFAL